jgi:hypothetical protein
MKGVKQMKLKEEELYKIQGGAVTATLLNALSRAASTILEIGRSVGSAIRRAYSKNYC